MALVLLVIALPAAGQGLVGFPYNATLGYAGDGLYVKYRFESGTLPPGLVFDNSTFGAIVGIPTQAGTYTFTVSYCNLFTDPGVVKCATPGEWTPQQLTITVRQPCGTLSKSADVFDFHGGTGTVMVSAPSTCAWSVSGGVAPIPLPFWISLSYVSNVGNGSVTYTVAPSTYGRSATFIIGDTLFTVSQRRTAQVFQDVPPPSDFFDAINLMAGRHITVGCSATPALYCPGSTATRGQMAVFIIRGLSGETFDFPNTPYFEDVPPTHPYFRYIQRLRATNITVGCGPSSFCPERPASRAEAVTLLIRAALGPATPFTFSPEPWFNDVPASSPFFGYIQKALELRITQGCGNGSFCPDAPVTREQAATLVMRALFSESLP